LEYKFTDGPIKLQKLDAALLAGDTEIEIDVPDDIEEIAERVMSFTKIDKVVLPDGLKATLRDYQLDGFYWMQFLAKSGFNGILADDMGLGKTLQTLTHILAEKESGRDGGRPSLVVAPTSVVVNWQREAAKFAPGLKVLILQGPQRHHLFSQIADADIVLSSFALIPRDLEYFKQQHFHQIILDEAQHIKNPSAKISQAVRELSSNHRLCLSGTPIENHLGELWSQFSFLMPGLLGSNESFNENYRNPIEKDHSEAKRNLLNAKVGPLILRRTKHDVAKELPPKTEILHSIELHTEQKDLYETVRSTMDKQVRQAIIARGGQAQIVFLDALLKLRQICCHPTLLKQNHNATESAKFDYLVDLLETLRRENHRVLIFSQFTSMLSLIEAHLIAEDVGYLILTGATKDRQSLVERFQGGEGEVFLISLKAGGTGLTLTGADTVIHYDPWWNPAAENQAHLPRHGGRAYPANAEEEKYSSR
jgi:SNF2 family DNA or RNA helicase